MKARKTTCGQLVLTLKFLLTLLLMHTSLATAAEVAGNFADLPSSFADLVEKKGPAVVNVYTTKVLKGHQGFQMPFGNNGQRDGQPQGRQEMPDFFKKFFDMPEEEQGQPEPDMKAQSLGSGVIVSADGYIVTNNHVVDDSEEIKVRCTNHEEYDAKIIGRDPKTDVALIKIVPKNGLTYVGFGNSDSLRVGDWVVAVGNPFGLENTVTAGIVSGKGRSIGENPYENFIQTDASINMGNSGGPLFNIKGDLVGINTAIYSRSGGSIGLGFAIPANMVKNVVDQLKESGKVTRGWLGVMIQHVTADLAKEFGLERPFGALVGEVMKGSPADEAGVKQGDVIVAFMGKEINQMSELPAQVAQTKVGTTATLTIVRKGEKKVLNVKIGKLDEEQLGGGEGKSQVNEKLGLTMQELTPELAKTMNIKTDKGLIVSDVAPGSAAAMNGIKRGTIILEINQKAIQKLAEFNEIIKKAKEGDNLLLLVKEGDHTRFVVIKYKLK
ncbi:MAG: DegQ family serine endoprotease [Desulfobulbaceae bacterium]|nr:DegQ family serine endoprotease [Desulfobulbaceae bacterium]